jgi:hypothetical protein
MTHVYGNARTCVLSDVHVGHMTGASRYTVRNEHACYVEPLIVQGHDLIERYIESALNN